MNGEMETGGLNSLEQRVFENVKFLTQEMTDGQSSMESFAVWMDDSTGEFTKLPSVKGNSIPVKLIRNGNMLDRAEMSSYDTKNINTAAKSVLDQTIQSWNTYKSSQQ